MRELLRDAPFEWLPLETYREDFDHHFWRTGDPGFWKLERAQYFQEPENDSWSAFVRGDWVKSLELIEARLAEMRDYYGRIADSGFTTRRVRIVEEPFTEYLQWELHVLRARDANGGLVRVLEADSVEEWESVSPLPEIYTLGTELMYEAVYDRNGILASARKFTDRALVERCQKFISELYAEGEPLQSYFDRRIAGLPAPRGVPDP